MNVFLIVMLVAIGLLFVYEAIMLVRSIIKRKKEKDNRQFRKPTDKLSNNSRKE